MSQRRVLVAFAMIATLGALSGRSAIAQNLETLLLPADRLAIVQSALPDVVDPAVARVIFGAETLWYDDTVMKRSYQDSVGASSNDKWPDLVAAPESIIGGLHDRAKHRWQFPFATTAGTDESTNIHVENFVSLPQVDGRVVTMPITTVILNDNRPEWRWKYPEGTVFGEVLFLQDGQNLLPVEIRTRKKYPAGWSMNVYRPFPRATDLAKRIQALRPNWKSVPNLKAMVDYLNDPTTLVPASMAAKAALAPTFSQEGYLDPLPSFGDDDLVRELLTTTPFRPSYGQKWKTSGDKKTFAASTRAGASGLSIVPTNYKAGLIEVSDDSCMRCHKETNRLVSEFYPALYLYGELWGMDGIFSFHPYDEKHYPELRFNMVDNRYVNPTLEQAGIFRKSFREAFEASHSRAL